MGDKIPYILEGGLDGLIPQDHLGFVATVPEHTVGSGFLDQVLQHLQRFPSPEDEARTALFEALFKGTERLMQPPAGGGAGQ